LFFMNKYLAVRVQGKLSTARHFIEGSHRLQDRQDPEA
jgi:hypothetical protein